MLRAIVVLTALVTVMGAAEAGSRIPEHRKGTGWGVQPLRRALTDEVSFDGDEVSNDELSRLSEQENLDDVRGNLKDNKQGDTYDDSSDADDENYASDEVVPEMWDQAFFEI